MSAPRPRPPRGTATRGPLPPGVYWRRRLFVLGVAFATVFVVGRWLSAGSDGSSTAPDPVAEQAGARVEPTQTVTAGAEPTTAGASAGPRSSEQERPTPTLAPPEGVCSAADVVVTPSVRRSAVAGQDVDLRLSLQTVESEACTWEVARSSVVVRIADERGELWSTRECRRAVPTEQVVVRRDVATVVELQWNARESDAGCTRRTNWVLPGDYTISAAALGGEPTSADFSLAAPSPRTITPDDEFHWVQEH